MFVRQSLGKRKIGPFIHMNISNILSAYRQHLNDCIIMSRVPGNNRYVRIHIHIDTYDYGVLS